MNNQTEIEVTATVEQDGVCLFETDAVAVIDWDNDFGLFDWDIVEFRFDKPRINKSTSIGKGNPLFAILKDGIDSEWLGERVAEKAGYVSPSDAEQHSTLHHGGSGVL